MEMQPLIYLETSFAYYDDNEYGIAYINPDVMNSLDISEGDAIEIIYMRRTVAKCLVATYPYKVQKGIIELNEPSMVNAGISLHSDTVIIRKIKANPAEEIIVSPLGTYPSDVEALKVLLAMKLDAAVLTKGQYFELKIPQGILPFQVIGVTSTNADAVVVQQNTVFNVKPRKIYTIEEIQRLRFLFLCKIYEKAESDTGKRIDVLSLGREIDLDFYSVRLIVDFLVKEELVKVTFKDNMLSNYFPTIWNITITHRGVKELEKAINRPKNPTKYFPANIIYNIRGDYIRGDRVLGDVFKNIQNSTIINKALVQDAFNKVKERDEETSKAILNVAKFIEKSSDPYALAAGALFDSFNQELTRENPDKCRLKNFWLGIEKVLPAITTISEAVSKVSKLFI